MSEVLASDRLKEGAAALFFLLVPVKLLWLALGQFRAPGLGGEGLYGELFAGATVRRWWELSLDPGVSDVLGPTSYWPASPLTSLLMAVLPTDPGFSLGLVTLALLWVNGFGSYLLAKKLLPDGKTLGWLVAGLAVQVGPSALRGIPGAELAALGAGCLGLGLAVPPAALAIGLLSWPGAVLLTIAGAMLRDIRVALGGLPVLAVLIAPSTLPGALRQNAVEDATSAGYLSLEGAVFPLPPAEAVLLAPNRLGEPVLWAMPGQSSGQNPGMMLGAPTHKPGLPGGQPVGEGQDPRAGRELFTEQPAEEEGSRPWIGAIAVPLQRIYGGPVVLVGLLVALWDTRIRKMGILGALALAGVTAVYGFQQFPEEALVAPRTVEKLYLLFSQDALSGLPSVLPWGGAIAVLGALGLARAVGRFPVLAVLPVISILLENPRMVAPVTSILPDPMMGMLSGLPEGRVVVFPSPIAPFHQGTRSRAALLYELTSASKSLSAAPTSGETGVVRALTGLTGLPVDTASARLIWESRTLTEPFTQAFSEGSTYLLLDLGAVPEPMRPQLDGWLAAKVGMPLAKEGSRLLYDLQSGPAGIVAPGGR